MGVQEMTNKSVDTVSTSGVDFWLQEAWRKEALAPVTYSTFSRLRGFALSTSKRTPDTPCAGFLHFLYPPRLGKPPRGFFLVPFKFFAHQRHERRFFV